MRAGALIVLLAGLASRPAAAAAAPAVVDPALERFIDEALGARPELAGARSDEAAASARVPQAEAWPDPMVKVGVQNDGFDRWQVGQMPTSFVSFMASQQVPFPGKRSFSAKKASAEARAVHQRVERLRLTTVADVRRAYLGLQWARARLELNARLQGLFTRAADTAQVRYESGLDGQADVLRARLAVSSVLQRRLALIAAEAVQQRELNRLRGRPLDEPVGPLPRLDERPFPAPPDEASALAAVRAGSPELATAHAFEERQQADLRLAHRSWFPDVEVSAGVMVRGSLPPMWTLTLGVPLPVYGAWRQARAVDEAAAGVESGAAAVATVEQVTALRTRQRLDVWRALAGLWRSYQAGYLADAEATATATLAQYRVGRIPLTSVLEAMSTSIDALDQSWGVLAGAWQVAIAQDEFALADVSQPGAVSPLGGGVFAAGGM